MFPLSAATPRNLNLPFARHCAQDLGSGRGLFFSVEIALPMATMTIRTHAWILVAASIVVTCLYWFGLKGPYLLDDYLTLQPVERWLADQQSWQQTLLPNSTSVINSRPVSMLSFMLTTWIGGPGTFPLKLGNLALHLFCGLLGCWVLRRALQLDTRLAPHAALLSAAAISIWLLHPLHVSTVLYSVQRMTQLAALFTIVILSNYFLARTQLGKGLTRLPVFILFVATPILLTLGVLSKQNAVIATILCLVLEIAYFRRNTREQRIIVGSFYTLFVGLPALAFLTLILVNPSTILAGYSDYDFNLWQRLLTQPRAIFHYIGMWFLPNAPQMGLYTDDFPVSTGILAPPSTLIAILALLVISLGAIAIRTRAPSVFAGWFFFLVAHAVESSILPLEMYYEHRNYLPSFGLMLMTIGLLALTPRESQHIQAKRCQRVAVLGLASITLVLAFSTLGRVLVWQSEDAIVTQGLRHHPNSIRARMDLISIALRRSDFTTAHTANKYLLVSEKDKDRLIGHLTAVTIDCLESGKSDQGDLRASVANAGHPLTVSEVRAVRTLFNLSEGRSCGNVETGMLADTIVAIASASPLDDQAPANYVVRSYAAQLYVRSGRMNDAERQAEIVWRVGQRLPDAALLARIYLQNDKHHDASELIGILKSKVRPFNTSGIKEVSRLQEMLDMASKDKPPASHLCTNDSCP